ncbi:hypothetical protein BD410DRAFT_150609 [Rickenella mellea]|uniref:F-box domain-containing protein n=1 Tax=Rickenella mellea TaxID=50990 RepID=A0A4Y7Q9A5_9AGAM|nr:hypothetical protein BD410DRAFT_150609 [Rickenella mellea]
MLLGYGQRSGFPAEIVLEICLLVTPIDLLKLYYTCRYFKTFLGQRPWVWRRARQRFLPPIPDPVLPPDPTANWSEVAYISLIFGGGKCSICHVPVQTLPNSFAMKERRCKRLACITRWK